MSHKRKLDMFTDAEKERIVRLANLPADQRPTHLALAQRFSTARTYINQIVRDASKKQTASVATVTERRQANG